MLGQIEFQEWQCLAELIDNSIDELRAWERDLAGDGLAIPAQDFCVEVFLPRDFSGPAASVEVRDHGRGMSMEALGRAVKAGWSGNDRFDSLGLYGMGFNVATARLGSVTRILTTRTGDPEWRGVEIDLGSVDEGFEVPEISEPKEDPSEHGTRVIVSRLDPSRLDNLVRKQDALRVKLGHVYGWLLDNSAITIRVNGTLVRAKRPCVWGDDRYVTFGAGRNSERIPAVIPIDVALPAAEACRECGNWQEPGIPACRRCGSTDLQARDRRIHGWVGIQRFLDTSQYGIDFLRNGRKILMNDKTVFSWTDINDPLNAPILEYPVETPATKGRIIGEIHLDHAPVDYKKDHFETSTREWISAIEILRGAGPLKPETAKRLGITGTNDSPIARLFRGYRRNDPGSRYLIPGDGVSAIHDQAADWARKFERGDAEYQSDSKWWEAVEFHDRKVAELNAPKNEDQGSADDEAVITALRGAPTTSPSPPAAQPAPTPSSTPGPAPLSIHDHVERLLQTATPIPSLSREIRSDIIGDRLTIEGWEIASPPLTEWQLSKAHTPVWIYQADGGRMIVFVDPKHEAFTKQGMDMLDLVLAELAYRMLVRTKKQDQATIPQVVYDLRRTSFPEANTDFTTVQTAARDTLKQIRAAVIAAVEHSPERAWGMLTDSEIDTVERQYSRLSLSRGQLDSTDSGFIAYVPGAFLLRLFQQAPDLFLDGQVFTVPYASLTSDAAKQEVIRTVGSLLADCTTLASEEMTKASTLELQRIKLSLEILAPLIVETP